MVRKTSCVQSLAPRLDVPQSRAVERGVGAVREDDGDEGEGAGWRASRHVEQHGKPHFDLSSVLKPSHISTSWCLGDSFFSLWIEHTFRANLGVLILGIGVRIMPFRRIIHDSISSVARKARLAPHYMTGEVLAL